MQEQFITTSELAARLGLSRKHVYQTALRNGWRVEFQVDSHGGLRRVYPFSVAAKDFPDLQITPQVSATEAEAISSTPLRTASVFPKQRPHRRRRHHNRMRYFMIGSILCILAAIALGGYTHFKNADTPPVTAAGQDPLTVASQNTVHQDTAATTKVSTLHGQEGHVNTVEVWYPQEELADN